MGRDVRIDVDVILEGDVVLGDGVRVGPYTRIRASELGARSEVLGHCEIEEAHIGVECRIGPYARLRGGVRLDERVRIGNFVEAKAVTDRYRFQGEPLELHGRRGGWLRRQHRRRHHHLQLRRFGKAPNPDRRSGLRRFRRRARGSGGGWGGSDNRSGLHDIEGCAGGRPHGGARPTDHHRRLAAARAIAIRSVGRSRGRA